MSDLHLELFPGFRIEMPPLLKSDKKRSADEEEEDEEILVLAGDIGDPATDEYRAFLEDCVAKFPRGVFVILGNHEGYGHPSWDDAVRVARSAATRAGATLHRDAEFLVPGEVKIAGATLWSRVEGAGASDVRCFIADYRRIGRFGVADGNAQHDLDVAWIRGEIALAEAGGYRLVVVTHHAPSLKGTSAPAHDASPLNSAFATALDDLVDRDAVAAWIFGHTHFSSRRGKLVSNQRGYPDSDGAASTRFDPLFAISV